MAIIKTWINGPRMITGGDLRAKGGIGEGAAVPGENRR
jgi:hypothetical protein